MREEQQQETVEALAELDLERGAVLAAAAVVAQLLEQEIMEVLGLAPVAAAVLVYQGE